MPCIPKSRDFLNYDMPFLVVFTSFNIVSVLAILSNGFQQVDGKCGYESCPKTKPGFINVHLVPHSHDDAGWLKTVDQYYHGTNLNVDPGAVQYILDSTIRELQRDPTRKFIYVEIAFFWRWWKSQDEETKEQVVNLVRNGQLEFTSGGWVGSDEGTTHYSALVDQMTLGLRFLNDTFGECAIPKIGWQIDTFGHSREQASLFSQMGLDGLFLGRIDYQYRSHLRWNQEMEMIWSGSPNNLGKSAWLWTGILYNYYMPPDGFCFDELCKDDPINDDPTLDEYNVPEKVQDFLRIAKYWSQPYLTKNVLMPVGGDFQYMNALTWFKNLDKLIKYVNAYEYPTNSSTRVNVFYSTPQCYLQEVYRSKKTFPMKTGDFFPYSNDPYGFWNGYHTSRPTFKYYIRKANNFLQVCKQLAVGAFQGKADERIKDKIFRLSEPVALVQHHDGITGTAKQHVTDDYSKRLYIGMKSCEDVLDEAFRRLHQRPFNLSPGSSSLFPNASVSVSSTPQPSFQFCQLLNISACTPSENTGDFLLSVYNPLVRERRHVYIRIPVSSPAWDVKSKMGYISSETFIIPKPVLKIPGRESKASYELVFPVDSLPGLTLSNFRITENTSSREKVVPVKSSTSQKAQKESLNGEFSNRKGDIVIRNAKGLTVVVDGESGLLKSVARGSVQLPLKQNFYYYLGMAGNNSRFEDRASGAYIFRPNTTKANGDQPEVIGKHIQNFQVYRGAHLTEVHQQYSDWLSQVIRVYENSDFVEFEWLVGPIPIGDGFGKEVITRYSTDLATNGTFYTDSNGRQLVKRKRNSRDFPFTNYEKVAGNYYPVTSRIMIEAEENVKSGPSLMILTDRAQGGSSLQDGEIELMLHRRLLYDDAFGVEEALNEKAFGEGLVARGRHWLLLAGEGTNLPFSRHRDIAQEIFMDKILAFSNITSSSTVADLGNNSNSRSSGSGTTTTTNTTFQSEYHYHSMHQLSPKSTVLSQLARVIPSNIHLLTMEPSKGSNSNILRLEHFYEKGEDPVNSKPVKIPVKAIIHALPFIKSLRETTLGANQWIEDVRKLEWNVRNETDTGTQVDLDYVEYDPLNEILLRPMEIKTFLIETIQ